MICFEVTFAHHERILSIATDLHRSKLRMAVVADLRRYCDRIEKRSLGPLSIIRLCIKRLGEEVAHGVLHDREAILDDDVVAIGLCELYRSLEKCQVWASN